MKTERELTIKFEMDVDGLWSCNARTKQDNNEITMSAGGKFTNSEGKDILEKFAKFVKELEYYSEGDFRYSRGASGK